jgi:serralysin
MTKFIDVIAMARDSGYTGDLTPRYDAVDTTADLGFADVGAPYSGPVAGIQFMYGFPAATDSINISARVPNSFILTGAGNDAIDVSHAGGTNVLDGGTGSNFLVGGTGSDTFFVDDRGAKGDIWSTAAGFHSGDAAVVWGVTAADFRTLANGEGANGYQGLTLHIPSAHNTASLTLSGYTTNDLLNGRLSYSFGEVDGNSYLYVHGN